MMPAAFMSMVKLAELAVNAAVRCRHSVPNAVFVHLYVNKVMHFSLKKRLVRAHC